MDDNHVVVNGEVVGIMVHSKRKKSVSEGKDVHDISSLYHMIMLNMIQKLKNISAYVVQ